MSREASSQPERRQFPRAILEVPVTAVRRNTPVYDQRHVIGLHVLNVSRGGLGAVTSEALPQREPVIVFFPPLGARKGRDTSGRIVRCAQQGNRFSVGIAFEEPWPEREEIRLGP